MSLPINDGKGIDLSLSPALSKLPRFSFTGVRAPSNEVASQSHDLAFSVRSPKDLLVEADLRLPNLGAKRSPT